jgi:periplasmic divalent cation tolerance protein
MNMILILVSFESRGDAEKVANALIDKKLAACVSLTPVTNFYYWKKEKVRSNEIEGIIKTRNGNFENVKKEIEQLLNYSIPQIIVLDAKTSEKYNKWVEDQTE